MQVKRKDGKFVVIKEKTGYTLNMNETFANFKKAVEAEKHQFELDKEKSKIYIKRYGRDQRCTWNLYNRIRVDLHMVVK